MKITKEEMNKDYKVHTTIRIEQPSFNLKVDVLNFFTPVKKRKYQYIPILVEADYKPLKESTRISFMLRAWDDRCDKKKLLRSTATGTSSFPYKRRYIIKSPCNLDAKQTSIILRLETYTNIVTHKGEYKETKILRKLEG